MRRTFLRQLTWPVTVRLQLVFIINNSYMAIRADFTDYITFVKPLAATDALAFLLCFFFHNAQLRVHPQCYSTPSYYVRSDF